MKSENLRELGIGNFPNKMQYFYIKKRKAKDIQRN